MFYDYFRASDAVSAALIDGSEWMVPLLGDAARDALAGVTAEQLPDLAAVLTGLANLSRRARAAGQHLLCRWSQ